MTFYNKTKSDYEAWRKHLAILEGPQREFPLSDDAQEERVSFWYDCFRDDFENYDAQDFYYLFGWEFNVPTKRQIRAVLKALDESDLYWDQENPRCFFSVLEHNYPELKARTQR